MNAHNPFDAKQDWTNPYCQNSSNDPMVDALLGNAYHVVRTVYCNLGNLKLIYDFLNQYGMVLGVQSEAELKALTTKAKYARIYGFSRAGDRQVTDYLYVEGDRTGILPDDTTATGSWITVATSGSNGGGTSSGEGAYIPWVYNNGSATGGETSINVPDGTVGVPFIIINGDMQYVGRGFEFNADSLSVTLAQPLEEGDEVVFLLTGVPAVPDNPNVNDWVQINWLYNNGAAVGGEQVIAIPYTFQSIPAVYKNGLRLYKGLTTESYTVDPDNQRIFLTEPLATNDRLIVQIGGESQILEAADHTLQEVARVANVKDSEVILSTDTVQSLNNKKVIYNPANQQIYVIPELPANVYISSVVGNILTYTPGNIQVRLLTEKETNQITLWRDEGDVRGYGDVSDPTVDVTSVFLAASAAHPKGVYVPEGMYLLPTDLTGKFWGPGRRKQSLSDTVGIPFNNPGQSHGTLFVGYDAGKNYSGDPITGQVVGVGPGAGRNVSTGYNITALGVGVLTGDTLSDALTDTSFCTGYELIGIGVNALKKAITLNNSIGIGRDALNENKFGAFNIGIGSSALQQLHTGSGNVALGRAAGMRAGIITDSNGIRLSFSTVNGGTFIGNGAGRELQSGDYNTYVGSNAGRGVTSTTNTYTGTSTGGYNTAIGTDALNAVGSASYNVALGVGAAKTLASGNNNIMIGPNAGAGITSGDNQLVIANQGSLPFIQGLMGAPQDTGNYIRFDASVLPAVANTRMCGNSTRPWSGGATQTAFAITSDRNEKQDITELDETEQLVAKQAKALIRKYRYKSAVAEKGEDSARYHVGVIAQDIKELFESHGLDPYALGIICYSEWDDEETGEHKKLYSVRYEELLCFIISAL